MIERADDVSFGFEPHAHGLGWLVIHRGRDTCRLRSIDKLEYRSLRRWSEQAPQKVAVVDHRSYWMFAGRCFSDDDGLGQRQVRAQLESRLVS